MQIYIENWQKNEAPNYLGSKRADEFLNNLKDAYREISDYRRGAATAFQRSHRQY